MLERQEKRRRNESGGVPADEKTIRRHAVYFFGDTYFPGAALKNTFQILFILVLLTEGAILALTLRNTLRSPEKSTAGDRGSMLLMMAGYWSAVFLNPVCVRALAPVLPEGLFWGGAVMMLAGLFIRAYSVWTLGRFFTLQVRADARQELVRSGPYRCVRHPAYTGSILTLLGIALAFRSPLGLAVTVLLCAAVYGYRIRVEEKAMEERFGEAYREYCGETWRLIPHVW